MALADYSELKAAVGDFLNRQDLVAVIPTFIRLAEAQISRRLLKDGPVRRMMARADAMIATEFASVPLDFMGVRGFYLTGGNRISQLQFLEPEQIIQKKAQTSQPIGCPQFFSVVGGEFQFFPAPTEPYTAELTYWQSVPGLSDSSPSNWMLRINPDAYLYGALLQSAPYLKDDARISVWASAQSVILSDIIQADQIERHAPFMAMPSISGGTP